MTSAVETDVCVLGGGPAGAIAALRLVCLGHRVCIVERGRRGAEIQSVAPSFLSLLEPIGISGDVKLLLRPARRTVRWGNFHAEPSQLDEHLVNRHDLDHLLLTQAIEAGAQLLQPANAAKPRRSTSGWVVAVTTPGGPVNVHAPYIVNACGRSARRSEKRHDKARPTIALMGHGTSPRIADAQTIIRTHEDHWSWTALSPGGRLTSILFFDAEMCHNAKCGPAGLFARGIGQDDDRRYCDRLRFVGASNATPITTREPVGDGFVKVGAAALALDPVSSQGLVSAATTALQGALVAHTSIARPSSANIAAEFYRVRVDEASRHHRLNTGKHYAAAAAAHESSFWIERAVLDDISPNVSNMPIPAILSLNTVVRIAEQVRMVALPSARLNYIEMVEAVMHPRLSRPVAFVADIHLTSLLAHVGSGITVGELLRSTASPSNQQALAKVLQWAHSVGVLTHEASQSTYGGGR